MYRMQAPLATSSLGAVTLFTIAAAKRDRTAEKVIIGVILTFAGMILSVLQALVPGYLTHALTWSAFLTSLAEEGLSVNRAQNGMGLSLSTHALSAGSNFGL